ncbi:hypothetical protein [Streptacidiphilus jiangxiensis]|uniref:Uncharacterized protein n=1 Tax=Streptacidiphilus jiangxiensis TaxID=235985 RepID=A0A1H7QHD5_STRJI|nr:hypothetical protein [Streptacidiphilus jiangxiensis]SEL47054.1 hypothetical protein SAMN05414137_1099 [Streptacidiphilus jiangxiensis]
MLVIVVAVACFVLLRAWCVMLGLAAALVLVPLAVGLVARARRRP